MKHKKRIPWLAAVCCLLLLAVGVKLYTISKFHVRQYVQQNQAGLTGYVEDVLQRGPCHGLSYNSWEVYYFNVVCFKVSYFGIAPSSTEKGFYYSPDDTPQCVGTGAGMDFVPDGAGWTGTDSYGNTEYTEKILDHWYWYELKL